MRLYLRPQPHHTAEEMCKSSPHRPVELDESERTRGGSAMSDESQTNPPEPGQKLSLFASLPWPLPQQDVCSHIEIHRNMNYILSARGACPGTT